MPLRQWGGVSFVACSLYSKGRSSAPALDSSGNPRGQKGIESWQNRAKPNICLPAFVSPREFRRLKTAKTKIYFTFGGCRASRCGSPFGAVVVSTGAGGAGFEASGPVIGWLWSSGVVFPAFCPLSRLALGGLLANMALFRVLRAFLGRFYGVCVGLCCLRALRGLCGFLCACGVRRFKGLRRICLSFSLFVPVFLSFSLFAYLLGLYLCCPRLVLLYALFVLVCLWVLCFLFPLRTIRKKKGRAVLVRPLFVCCGLLLLFGFNS